TPPHLRDARSRGVPALGRGAVYQIPESQIVVPPIPIPPYWPRCYGLDVGWRVTAAVWVARDPSDGVLYAYSEHYRAEAPPLIHAEAIRARGAWIPGLVDPASRGRSQADGRTLFNQYASSRDAGGLGLKLATADNSVEAGIYRVATLLEQGRLKIFATLSHTLSEYRLYRRDDKGRIVKADDHCLDALRYAVVGFDRHAMTKPVARDDGPGAHIPGDKRAGY
ncbi:MAG: hypothetical protein D6688_10220, partial [Alphaproteobacteria bacterium]